MADFPVNKKAFTVKRNLLDDVKAEHINEIQDEIAAIQNTLRTQPQRNASLSATVHGTNDWGSVGARLDSMQRGEHIPVIQLRSATESVATSVDKDIDFDSPHIIFDTGNMFDGIGFTVKRGGWWILTSDIVWEIDAGGERQHLLMNGTTELVGSVIPGPDYWTARTNVVWQGPLQAGRKITVRVRQTSGRSLALPDVTLSGTFVRELTGIQVY